MLESDLTSLLSPVKRSPEFHRHGLLWTFYRSKSQSTELLCIEGGRTLFDLIPSSTTGWNGRERSGDSSTVSLQSHPPGNRMISQDHLCSKYHGL
jgi:hypothetical protein